ncbi:MAG: efflux RND transporter periplasmic adaptor subunit [Deltaproteobacteria bacterium]|jgi:multidrug efflux pump subunit AcrA (membrane-fusion protein)|nr:efflux RND transporter periplasmic adaptor subunit [Deltaproteobacteria bacterium]
MDMKKFGCAFKLYATRIERALKLGAMRIERALKLDAEQSGRLLKFVKEHKKISALCALVLLFVLFRLFFGGVTDGKPQVLATAEIGRGTVVKTLNATGIVTPEVGAIVKIGSRANGFIRKMHVRVGDEVRKDQVIAEIDSRELEAQVAEAEAALSRAEVEYERILNTYPLQIREAEAQTASARASADYQDLNFKRRKQLVEQDLDAHDTLDVARQQQIAAQQALVAAQATRRRLEEEFLRQRESAEQAKKQAEASLVTARIRLDYATIRTPMDGVVSQVTAQEGETVVAGLQVVNLITVLDPSRLEMWVYVDETDVGQVKPGMVVEFSVDSLPGKTFTGQVSLVYPEPEVKDSIVYYRTVVPLDKATALQLKAQMTTQCRVIVGSKENVLMAPNEAVKWVNGEQVVYKVDRDGGIKPAQVLFGMRGAEASEVLEGLSEGDVVATRLVLGSAP